MGLMNPPKKNLIMPVAPMFATIMTGPASHLVKKICRVVDKTREYPYPPLSVVKETNWNQGPGNDNLEQCSLNVGTIGMVVGVAEPKTVLRFLVTSEAGNENIDGIYHVSVLNLELYEGELS